MIYQEFFQEFICNRQGFPRAIGAASPSNAAVDDSDYHPEILRVFCQLYNEAKPFLTKANSFIATVGYLPEYLEDYPKKPTDNHLSCISKSMTVVSNGWKETSERQQVVEVPRVEVVDDLAFTWLQRGMNEDVNGSCCKDEATVPTVMLLHALRFRVFMYWPLRHSGGS